MTIRATHREQGTALLLALFFFIVVAGLVFAGSLVMQSHRVKTETSFRLNAQAAQFAHSGLIEGLSWFRRQTTQPVLQFEPVLDSSASPPVLDTDDPEVGLMREFRIASTTWGRYEVWKEWELDPDAQRLAWRRQMQCGDVSDYRGRGSAGSAWRLQSIGYIFENNDPSVAFDVAPNRVLAIQMLETEVVRLNLAPPGQAAVSVSVGGNASVASNGRVIGGSTGAGIYYPSGTGTPSGGSRISGTPGLSPATPTDYDDSHDAVFGVSYRDLSRMAADYITNPADFPSPVPEMDLIVAEVPSITFTSSRPLRGTGVVCVRGDVVLQAGSNSVFNGLLYVEGNLTMNQPCEVNGAVVVTGNVTIQGVSDYSTVNFDDGVLTALRQEIGNYRLFGALRPVRTDD